MSYHRGGHPGAVAVSYSTNTMAPLSPSRRYSGSNGSTTGSTSSTTGGSSTSKYSYGSSVGDRPGSFHSSVSTTGYRASSYASSTDSFRRPFISPARSVSSYNETSSIVGSSTIAGSLRYGSASSSSASSTASSNSSCGSRDRNVHHHHPTPSSLASSTADLYAKYSPTFYVPNICGSSTSIGNGHWRPSSSNSSSGISSSALAELHGGDDYDSCRDRRDRSYSSETSSGIGLLSSNSSINNSNNFGSTGITDRWSARREAKRRITPVLDSGVTVLTGYADSDGDPAATEVTVNADDRNNIPGSDSSSSSSSGSSSSDGVNRRAAATTSAESAVTSSSSSSSTTAPTPAAPSTFDVINNDRNHSTEQNPNNDDRKSNDRDLDNNNYQKNNNNNKNNNKKNNYKYKDFDTLLKRDNNVIEQRRRRKRVNVDQQLSNVDSNDHDENNETLVARNNRDFNVKSNFSEITEIIGIGNTCGDNRDPNLHHHDRSKASSNESREFVVSVTSTSVDSSVANISNVNVFTSNVLTSASSSSFSPPVTSSTDAFASSVDVSRAHNRGVSRSIVKTKKSLNSSDETSIVTREDDDDGGGGVGGGVADAVFAGGDADHHRNAYTWTKIPTNPDNTELLTNNNGQDREVDVLAIVDPRSNVEINVATPKTKIRDRSVLENSVTRKSLLWTATNDIDDDNESKNVTIGINVRKLSSLESAIPIVINNDDDEASGIDGASNGARNEENNDANDSNPVIYDFDAEESAEISLRINGVTGRPTGSRSDDPGKPSTSRRTLFGWNEPTIDDQTGASSSTAASSSTNNSVPVAVHQNFYRGINEHIDESSNSRPTRNRLLSRRDERYGLNGLRNIGNTCFMNSVIQCLSNTRPLLEYLLNEQHLHDINTTTSSMKGALIKAFGQVIHELWETSGDHVVNTTALKSQIQRFAPRFMGYSQQDAQEFLRYLLEGLHEDVNRVTVKPQPILTDIPDHYSDSHKAAESWKRYLRSEDSTIVDVFVGQLRSSLHCTSCDHVSVTLDPVWDLSLPIPVRSGTVKLNQCLEHFTKVETMDGDEKPTCSKCQMRRKCTKSFSIQKFPKILVIHLKRFSPTERFRGKLSVLVDFPLTGLDLSAFAAPGVQGCTYNLYGVANHSGTTYSGHYTAYCKHPYSGEWHEYNDNRVSSVPARSVVSSEAYVLFYEQQSTNPHL